MSIAITIEFLAGRYHATPWNRQVNEGAIEWPPSPWRILRALVAGYHRLGDRRPPRADLLDLLVVLAEQLPCYQLPPKTEAHTRHYMPLLQGTTESRRKSTTRIIDAFAAIARPAILTVEWPGVSLNAVQRELLALLCAQVSYLGRAESWAELRLHEGESVPEAGQGRAEPSAAASQADEDSGDSPETANQATGETVELLAPLNRAELAGLQAYLATLPAPVPAAKGRGKRGRPAPPPSSPADLLAALELDIGQWHAEGWSGIPGAKWVRYELRSAQPVPQPAAGSATVPTDQVQVAYYALTAPVLPKLTVALRLGERARQALIRLSADAAMRLADRERSRDRLSRAELGEYAAPVFVGRDGEAIATGHAHAYYLPEDADGDGRIDRLAVFAREGFGSLAALQALARLQRLWDREAFEVQAVLLALGEVETLAESGSLLERSRSWESQTPFYLSRHPRRRKSGEPRYLEAAPDFQVEGPEQQAIALLQKSWGLAGDGSGQFGQVEAEGLWLVWQEATGRELVRVRQLSEAEARDRRRHPFPWFAFWRQRSGGGSRRAGDRGYWLRLEFPEPVQGPIALGYGAHFGLSLFRPAASA